MTPLSLLSLGLTSILVQILGSRRRFRATATWFSARKPCPSACFSVPIALLAFFLLHSDVAARWSTESEAEASLSLHPWSVPAWVFLSYASRMLFVIVLKPPRLPRRSRHILSLSLQSGLIRGGGRVITLYQFVLSIASCGLCVCCVSAVHVLPHPWKLSS